MSTFALIALGVTNLMIWAALFDTLRSRRRTDANFDRLVFAIYTYASNQQHLAARQKQGAEAKLEDKAVRRYTQAESAANDLNRVCADIIKERRGVSL